MVTVPLVQVLIILKGPYVSAFNLFSFGSMSIVYLITELASLFILSSKIFINSYLSFCLNRLKVW